ncbi:YlmH family RNA-binding protein [Brevibacillus borstelensis]|uniref:YlmH family RNA-binding protein n=1 Tax=Brevibacillus borstelensis TaxID=45462 RepID=UPI00287FDCF5|nr:YlmH/Sll1252 family protein [Brevibacillus borstelensis]WNF07709.1 YlmH/Sll1252 family protein [Brevibacillus borstelensis]
MSVYDHFRKEELPFVERALEMLTLVERKQAMRLTDFLDPRQAAILKSLTSQVQDVSVTANGGYEGAERVRVMLHPDYLTPEAEEFRLTLLHIAADQRFKRLEHRDVMGALLNAGLKREKFGDMIVDESGLFAVVAEEVADFVRVQVTHIHRTPVLFEKVEWASFQAPSERLTEKTITVPSPRVDAVIGEVYHLSRAKAVIPIRAGRLKVNWKVVDDPSYQLETGDMVSLAGFGRFKLLEVAGATRSGRLRMNVGLVT